MVYGGFTSNVDMQSGAPAFGTPEYMRTAMIGSVAVLTGCSAADPKESVVAAPPPAR